MLLKLVFSLCFYPKVKGNLRRHHRLATALDPGLNFHRLAAFNAALSKA